MQLHMNASDRFFSPLEQSDRNAFGPGVLEEVHSHLACIQHRSTPLLALSAMATHLRVGAVLVKDEGQRSGLRSFKALGGAHAVIKLVLQEVGKMLGRELRPDEISSEEVRACAGKLTITCATDGNHGRSVAAAGAIVGCRCVIFIHEGVSESRAEAIAAQGASVVRVKGNYDDSVDHASRQAIEHGWFVVSDTSWPGYESIPTWVMQGYLVMIDEALRQSHARGQKITHVFLQAGVGGYAAAISAYLINTFAASAPCIVIVEPDRAACLYESGLKQQATRIQPQKATVMAMLECYEPSLIAWRILERTASAFMTISDNVGLKAMGMMANPLLDDPYIQAGESGAAGFAGLQAAAASPRARALLAMDENAVVLVFNTEGATDEALYESLLLQAKALP
jgi:diaminopropionate ammonia-lyase